MHISSVLPNHIVFSPAPLDLEPLCQISLDLEAPSSDLVWSFSYLRVFGVTA
uniref:Uncharacterized protein n=1 Tax=Kalanchoe fedtschenkoi TaxID=63787 RepID=A0A7N0T5F1_KALFE